MERPSTSWLFDISSTTTITEGNQPRLQRDRRRAGLWLLVPCRRAADRTTEYHDNKDSLIAAERRENRETRAGLFGFVGRWFRKAHGTAIFGEHPKGIDFVLSGLIKKMNRAEFESILSTLSVLSTRN